MKMKASHFNEHCSTFKKMYIKDTFNRVTGNSQNEKIFENYVSDNALISRI
jgi:hypothetical protein